MTVEEANYTTFRDCVSEAIVASLETRHVGNAKRSRAKSRRSRKRDPKAADKNDDKNATDPNLDTSSSEDMAEFVEYLAMEIWHSLPDELRGLSYTEGMQDISANYSTSTSDEVESVAAVMPSSVLDSLSSYELMDIENLLANALPAYITSATAPPPIWSSTRPEACELCQRDWINLTYHHLIPRSTHDKALKRGWHEEWELNRVAWLCAACHRCVHRVATNDELAQYWNTLEKLQSREDIQRFAQWVGNVRWKKK